MTMPHKIDNSVICDLWIMFKRERNCSIDRMVCDPKLRDEFLESARSVCGTDDEFTILWTAMNLRKSMKLHPESLGVAPILKCKTSLESSKKDIRL